MKDPLQKQLIETYHMPDDLGDNLDSEQKVRMIESLKLSAHAAELAATVAAESVKVAAQVAEKAAASAAGSSIEIAKITGSMEFIRAEITDIKTKLDSKYVTIETWTPVRNLVYGMVAVILTSFMGAIAVLIFKK